MFQVIGQDGKEYTASAAQLIEWLRQGRITRNALVRPAGGKDFAPLSSYPELVAEPSEPIVPPKANLHWGNTRFGQLFGVALLIGSLLGGITLIVLVRTLWVISGK